MTSQANHPFIQAIKAKKLYNTPFILLATINIQPAKEEYFLEEARRMISASVQEKDCNGYELHKSTEHPKTYIFVEKWADGPALESHLATDYTQRFTKALKEVLAGQPDVKFFSIVPKL